MFVHLILLRNGYLNDATCKVLFEKLYVDGINNSKKAAVIHYHCGGNPCKGLVNLC